MLKQNENLKMKNLSNNYTLEAIKLLNNMSKDVEKKLKKANILGDNEDTANLIPLIIESLQSNKKGLDLFRKSNNNNEFLTKLWVSKVKKIALKQFLLSDNPIEFKGISKKDLSIISAYSYDSKTYTKIKQILLDEYGILLYFIHNIEGMKTDAVTFKLSTGTPVIGMSLRFPQYDRFWFTLMHELSHICLHYDLLDEPIIDNNYDVVDSIQDIANIENEADDLARISLVPDKLWKKCRARKKINDEELLNFCKDNKIHPTILSGFIKYDQKRYYLYKNFNKNIVREKLL